MCVGDTQAWTHAQLGPRHVAEETTPNTTILASIEKKIIERFECLALLGAVYAEHSGDKIT